MQNIGKEKKQHKISFVIMRWILVLFLAVITAGMLISNMIVTIHSIHDTSNEMTQDLIDVEYDIHDMYFDFLHTFLTDFISQCPTIEAYQQMDESQKNELWDTYSDVLTINIIDKQGTIVDSNEPENVGSVLENFEESAEYLLLQVTKGPSDSVDDLNFYMREVPGGNGESDAAFRYAFITFMDYSGVVQVGISSSFLNVSTGARLQQAVINRHIGHEGFLMILDDTFKVVGCLNNMYLNEVIDFSGIDLNKALLTNIDFVPQKMEFHDIVYYTIINQVDCFYVVALVPVSETQEAAKLTRILILCMEAVLFAILLSALIWMLKRKVVNEIVSVNNSLSRITDGELEEKVDVRSSEDFSMLSDGINQTVDKLKGMIAAEATRMNKELELASRIQQGLLPNRFPLYPDRKEFDIYAMMNPAKEVGGDFYDCFLVDENHLCLIMADVSGKGIPAAIFMAMAMSRLKNRALAGGTPSQILFDVNNQMMENNAEEYFVTVWMAILDLQTGKGIAANAGHEHPVLMRKGHTYELVIYPHSLAVAAMEDIPFKQHEFELYPGDRIFVYTDGLPEAVNTKKEMYGNDRIVEVLNRNLDREPADLLHAVSDDVQEYTGEEPQFDDLTMMDFRYYGPESSL